MPLNSNNNKIIKITILYFNTSRYKALALHNYALHGHDQTFIADVPVMFQKSSNVLLLIIFDKFSAETLTLITHFFTALL